MNTTRLMCGKHRACDYAPNRCGHALNAAQLTECFPSYPGAVMVKRLLKELLQPDRCCACHDLHSPFDVVDLTPAYGTFEDCVYSQTSCLREDVWAARRRHTEDPKDMEQVGWPLEDRRGASRVESRD